jgi:2-C-methyl-D-erythritol 4-phosphate cytidylyltransferase
MSHDAVGHVPTTGRGSLPFLLMHDEALVVLASMSLERAGVRLLDFTDTWADVQRYDAPLVLHDPLCPLAPVDHLASCVELAVDDGVVVVGTRPVTDTMKTVSDDVVGRTVDRESLVGVTTPVVLPPSVVGDLDDWPDVDDFAALVERLRGRFEIRFVEAPALARRVQDESDLALLAALAGG